MDRATTLDMEAVARQWVRVLRGPRSQQALMRRLGLRGNTVYLWEKGRRFPTLARLFWLLHRTGHDVGERLRRLEIAPTEVPWSREGAAQVLAHFRGGSSITSLSTRLGRSRSTVSRWLCGGVAPRLPDALRFLEVASTRTIDFVALFTDPDRIPALADSWQIRRAAQLLVRELPWASAVLLALELDAYRALPRHDDAWLAERLGLSEGEVQRCVEALAGFGQIQRSGPRWRRVEIQAVDARTPQRSVDLKRWWLAVALERLEAPGLRSYNLCAVSDEDYEQICALQREHFRRVRGIVSRSQRSERLVLMNLHTITLSEGAAPVDPGAGAEPADQGSSPSTSQGHTT